MTKSGNSSKKKKMSASIQLKKSKMKTEKKLNPFEIKFAKAKYNVINRPLQTEAGKPGISRAKAIQKRKATLLQEYKLRDKKNLFVDRRIGELDTKLSSEEKMIARFTAERMKQHGKKSSIFNLGGEETLTHFGKSLADVERMDDDPRSDDEEDDESKRLSADYVNEIHFGGFLTRSDLEFAEGKSNTRKEWIDNIIAESKKKKADRQKNHQDTLNMTVDLDVKWKDMMPKLKSGGAIYSKKEMQFGNDEEDSYNVLMRELAFEAKKGKAQDRLKTDEEIIAEEKEKLEKMESDRLRRMKGEFDPDIDGEEEEEEMEADGEPEKKVQGGEAAEKESEEDDGSEEEEEEDESEEEEEEEGYSDLEESDQEDGKEKKLTKKKVTLNPELKRQIMEAAQKEIPFTFKVPTSYEELSTHFVGRSPQDKATVLERIIKCNHPQFGLDNKAQLETLFTFVLQHLHDCVSEDDQEELQEGLETVQKLAPFLFDMAKFFPQPAAKSISSVLQEKYEDYIKNPKLYPMLDTIIFFKLAILLFPSSDYRHPVVTPTLQFMSQVLANGKPFTRSTLAAGLVISSILVECVVLSKRFSPELLNFLVGIVFMSTPKDSQTVIPFVPPFKVVGKESMLLHDILKKKHHASKIKLSDINTEDGDLDPAFAASCLNTSLQLLINLADLWREFPSAWQMFQFLADKLIPILPTEKLDSGINSSINLLKEKLSVLKSESKDRKGPGLLPKKPVTMLKLYEPEIEDDFDPFHKKHGGLRENREKEKLEHKIKREKKSAKKELRKDTVFLAKQKSKEIREKDFDRLQRTKAIMGGLGAQEGEFKKFQAQKKKRR